MIERHSTGGRWERAVGYSRAVRAGPFVHVAGCTGVDEGGELVGDGDAEAQAAQACLNVIAALALAGARPEHVVRTRMYVTDILRWEDVGRAHAAAFGAAPPASSMVEVARLIDPRMLVEIEADAWVGE